jgi:hypothetical protein
MTDPPTTTNSARDYWVLVVLSMVALAYRLVTTQMIETGGDATFSWSVAMRAGEDPLPIIRATLHNSARMSINYVAYAFQQFFGSHPTVYYFPAYLMSVVQVVFVFLLCRRASGLWPAVLATIALILHPQLVRHGAQLLPAVFSGAYIIGAAYFLSRCYEPRAGSIAVNRTLAALFFFLAYMAKLPNLFFLPAFVLGVWAIRRDWRDTFAFLGLLFVLVALEWAFYVLTRGHFLGRLGAVRRHLGLDADYLLRMLPSEAPPLNWLDLFRYRYSPEFLGDSATATVFYISLASAIYLVWRWRRLASLQVLIGIALLSYVVLAGAAVKSLDPPVPFQGFNPRFLVVLVPLGMTAVAIVIADIATLISRRLAPHRAAPIFKTAIVAALILPILWAFQDRNQRLYFLTVESHPMTVLTEYVSTVNDAAANCVPFISEQIKSERALTRVFLRDFHRVAGGVQNDMEPYSIGFAHSCIDRFPDLSTFIGEIGGATQFDAVWTSRYDASGELNLTIERRSMAVSYLVEHFASTSPSDDGS